MKGEADLVDISRVNLKRANMSDLKGKHKQSTSYS
jgi:hypothetical protein